MPGISLRHGIDTKTRKEVEALVAFDSHSSTSLEKSISKLRSGAWRNSSRKACSAGPTAWESFWDAAAWGPFIWPNAWMVRYRNE